MNINELRKTNIDELTFSVVDTETTGMSHIFNRVIDIGIVKVKNGKIIDKYETLIDPEQNLDYWITKYTRLRDADLVGKPKFIDIGHEILDFIKESVFVAHNVYFDYLFLKREMKRIGNDFTFPKLCTVQLSKKLLPDLEQANLDSLSEYFGIKIINRHRALPDAEATAEILVNFIEKAKVEYKAKTYFDLEKLQWIKTGSRERTDWPNLFDI